MKRPGRRLAPLGAALLCAAAGGCSIPSIQDAAFLRPAGPPPLARRDRAAPPLLRVAAYEKAEPSPADATPPAPTLPAAGGFTADALVAEVLARNPSVAEMAAAWRAAAERYPQAVALDDPILTGWMAPASIDARPLNFAQRVELSQKFPWPGKRGLRGEQALAEASAAGRDVDDVRLHLTESARTAFADYYLAERALEVNAESLRLLTEFREEARKRYETAPEANKQDVDQADVEVGRQKARGVELERMRETAVARINTLRHLPPDAPLPPPAELPEPGPTPDAAALRAAALARRPDLRALADRIQADQAALDLARKEYCPDVEAMAAYDSFWQGKDDERRLRPQIGLRLNLPLQLDRRRAAVAEAEAKLAQRRAALDRQTDQAAYEVEQAAAQVRESEQTVKLYKDKILPAAEKNKDAALDAYRAGRIPYISLIEAERNIVELRDRYYEALAAWFSRRATLERVSGGPPDPAPPGR
jgi:outer membrane protein TolC